MVLRTLGAREVVQSGGDLPLPVLVVVLMEAGAARAATRDGPGVRAAASHGATWQALLVIDHGDDGTAAARSPRPERSWTRWAKTSVAHPRAELREAASAFERASRSHTSGRYAGTTGPATSRPCSRPQRAGPWAQGEGGAFTATLIDMALLVVAAAARWPARNRCPRLRQAAAHTASTATMLA
ncbi:hypothetical protein ACOZCI_25480 [Streptomyces griseoincarnatus]